MVFPAGNWSITTWMALDAVHAAGGYTWSNVNCMLDVYPPSLVGKDLRAGIITTPVKYLAMAGHI